MFTEAEINRIEEIKTLQESNCIGRILYIRDIIDADEYVGIGEKRWSEGIVEKYLNTLIKTDKPKLGSVVVVRNKNLRIGQKQFIEHMGLIVEENPLMIHEKAGENKPPKTILLSERLAIYDDSRLIEYYNNK